MSEDFFKISAAMESYTSHGLVYLTAGFLEIIIPVIVGFYTVRKYGTSWKVFGIGAIMFLLSLIRLPLNQYISLAISNMNFGSYTYALLVAFPSLTAGIFEESARYIAYKYIVKDYSIGNGLTLGSGHGGIESILLVGVNVLVVGIYLLTNPSIIPQPQLDAIVGSPSYLALVGLYERIMVIIFHICLSVIVLMTFRTGRKIYFGSAIALHFMINFFSVMASQYGIILSELVVTIFTLGTGYWVFRIIHSYTQEEFKELQDQN